MKNLKLYFPEIYLLVSIFFYWISTSLVFNWFAVFLLILLATLVFTKSNVLGIIYGSFFGLINLYMVLALLSELFEFTTFNSNAMKLLLVGGLFIGLNLICSILLIFKYGNVKVFTQKLEN